MSDSLERRSFLWTQLFVTLLFLYLLKPFFGVIFWASVISLLSFPLYRRFEERWHGRSRSASISTLAVVAVIGVIPALALLGYAVQEGVDVYQKLESGELDLASTFDRLNQALPLVRDFLARLGVDFVNAKKQLTEGALAVSGLMAQNALAFGQGTARFFADIGLTMYLAFFLLKDGRRILTMIMRALPLGDERERLLFSKFAEVTRATVKGNLVVALVQGALGGMIFAALGIPGALAWGTVMALFSMVPVVGAGLIWAPAAVVLCSLGHWIKGGVLVLFGLGVIAVADNVLRPILVGRDTKLPDYMVLLSTLGGFSLFGINGFVVGPLVAVLFVTFWEIFVREFGPGEIVE